MTSSKKLAYQAIEENKDFKMLVLNESRLNTYIDKNEIDHIFKPESYLKYVDYIYEKVFHS